MRLFFLALLASLAAALAALLLVPQLVDEAALARRVLAHLETALGESLSVQGESRLTLLPQPRLSLAQLVVGDARAGTAGVAKIERAEILLSYPSLLGFAPHVRELRLIRPQLRLARITALAPLLEALVGARADARALETLSIFEGRLVLSDPQLAHPLELAQVTLEAAREAERAVVAASGEARLHHLPLAFTFELRPLGGAAALNLKLTLGSGSGALRLGWRGNLVAAAAEPRLVGELELSGDGATLAGLADALALAGFDRLAGFGAFALRSRLELRGRQLALEGLRLATAAGEAEARLEAELGTPARFSLALESARFALPDEPMLARLAAWMERELPSDLAGEVRARVRALARAGEEMRGLELNARLPGDGSLVIERLAAELPGSGELALSGRAHRELAGPTFRGHLALRLGEVRPFARWLGLEPVAWPAALTGLALEGELVAAPDALALREAEVRAAGARARGQLAVIGGPPLRLELRAAVDRLVLDPWLVEPAALPLKRWLVDGPPAEPELAFDLSIARLSWRALRAEALHLNGELASGRLFLREARWTDASGAKARLSGSLGPSGAVDLDLALEVPEPAPFARGLGLDPGALFFLDGPLLGRAGLKASPEGPELALALMGPDGRLDAVLRLDRASLAPRALRVAAAVDDTRPLLARLMPGVPMAAGLSGPFRLEGEGLWRAERTWTIEGTLALGQISGSAALELIETAAAPLLRGRVSLAGLDAASFSTFYALAEPVLGLPRGPLASWPGAWPKERFGIPILPPIDLDLALSLSLLGRDGTPLGPGGLRLALAGDLLAVEELDMPLAGGRLRGALWIELAPQMARLEGRLALASAELAALAAALRIREDVEGVLDLELAAQSIGGSLADLAGNLEGEGSLTLRTPAGSQPLGLPASTQELVLHGPFTVTRGIARAPALLLETREGAVGQARALFDLLAWILDLELKTDAARGLRLFGPPEALRRYERAPSPRRCSRARPLNPKARAWSPAARWCRTLRSSRTRARVPPP